MTLAEAPASSPPRFAALFAMIASLRRRRAARTSVAHLDDRLRADIGLPPMAARAPSPRETAARIAMSVWR